MLSEDRSVDGHESLVAVYERLDLPAIQAIARYVSPDDLAIVVVGDRSIIEDRLRAANLGPVRLLEERRPAATK